MSRTNRRNEADEGKLLFVGRCVVFAEVLVLGHVSRVAEGRQWKLEGMCRAQSTFAPWGEY